MWGARNTRERGIEKEAKGVRKREGDVNRETDKEKERNTVETQ